mgnify:CR=1 FL=1
MMLNKMLKVEAITLTIIVLFSIIAFDVIVDVVNNMNNESVIPRNEFCIILGSNINKIEPSNAYL